MNASELKKTIENANMEYRKGTPVMSDAEYDQLLDEYKKCVSGDEYENFVATLNEKVVEDELGGKKRRHPDIMGSLEKLPVEDPEGIRTFLRKYVYGEDLIVSMKIDGISCRLRYVDGKIESATTRGDGTVGMVIDDKIPFIKNIPGTITVTSGIIDVRGELVIFRQDFEGMDGYANPRNAVAGIINRIRSSKEWNEDELRKVTFVPYTILGDKYTKREQFDILRMNFHTIATERICPPDEYMAPDFIDSLAREINDTASHPYEVDGAVICPASYRNEKEYRPKACRAVKTNQLIAESRIVDVEWQRPSKDGKIAVVGIIEPVELGGATVSRVTLNNLDFIDSMNIKFGSKVAITRRGDVIPAVTEVLSNEGAEDIEPPELCPGCGYKLEREGPFLFCHNPDCIDQKTYQMMHFIKRLGIENASFKTLENFGVHSMDDLLAFKANPKYKTEVKFEEELRNKLFSRSDVEIFRALNMKDIAEKTLDVIMDFYGWDKVTAMDDDTMRDAGLPSGIGAITLEKFLSQYKTNLKLVEKVTKSLKYTYKPGEKAAPKTKVEAKGTIVVTGAVYRFKNRDEFCRTAEDYGYKSAGSVSKNTTYLINNDVNSTSGKNKKAKQLGIPIISEDEFLKIVGYVGVDEL